MDNDKDRLFFFYYYYRTELFFIHVTPLLRISVLFSFIYFSTIIYKLFQFPKRFHYNGLTKLFERNIQIEKKNNNNNKNG